MGHEQAFMLHLPRICNHCLNPPCMASCPSKAIYKRAADGIVLVDEKKCRRRGVCLSACPYRKVYLNRVTGKAEKCMFCLPGVTEGGLPTLCSEACVGRIRSIGVVLYDVDAVAEVARIRSETDLVEAQRGLLLDPHDNSVISRAEESGVPHHWLEAARRSPAYMLVKELRVALPLHPEFRTLPMVWYVPPLSPVSGHIASHDDPSGGEGQGFSPLEDRRIPVDYIAKMLGAGDRAPIEEALEKLIAMRSHKRRQQLSGDENAHHQPGGIPPGIDQLERLYRLLGNAGYRERFVIPTAHYEAGAARREGDPDES